MSNDAEQASLRNLLPTGLMQGTAAALVTLPYATFKFANDFISADWASTPREVLLTKLLVAAAVFVLLAVLLAAEACWVLHKTRAKGVITRFSNTHPLMSFSWLWENAELKHLAALGTLAVVMFCAGFFLCEYLALALD